MEQQRLLLVKASRRYFTTENWESNHLKDKYSWEKIKNCLPSPADCKFYAGFPSTVYEFVKSGRYPRKGWFRRLNAHDEEHIKASLNSVGMWEHRDKRIGSLSGGQKQRAVIATYVCFRSRYLYLG